MMVIETIRKKLQAGLTPLMLDVIDESYKHAGHKGVEGREGGETHFHITVVSPAFLGLSRVKRHQKIYAILSEELKYPIHALSLRTLTADEYQDGAL
jgi:BolA protein